MDKEAIFREQLADLVKTARKQGMYLSKEQVLETFPDLSGQADKLQLVYDYLKSVRISVGEESDFEQFLSEEDKNYLAEYLQAVGEAAAVSAEKKREIILSAMAESVEAQRRILEIYLPDVAEIAKLYTGQGALLEDLIGEGNVALTAVVTMLGCLEAPEDADGFIGKFLMDAMEKFLLDETLAQKTDERALKKVNEIAKAAQELAKELRRKVTAAELAEESGFTLDEIEQAVRISGSRIEDIAVG